ncbi:MAG: NDP-sugar synthase [Candidatus Eremiobacteraeota bacterium]|nr:NDP-sugar synthase [Candidatus Eremiobacteraeota bacterium]
MVKQKAMILAGGMSTRLYPLTKQVPKPLVPVAGIPNAVNLIRYLKSHGCTEIAINVHYLAGQIVRELGDGAQFGVRLTYLHEESLLGSAGALKQMQSFFEDDDFFVVGCDDLTDLPLDELMAFHTSNAAIETIGLVQREHVDQYGVVVRDATGKITGFQEKPPAGTEQSKLVNTGIYAFTPEIFEHIPAREFVDFGKNVFPALQQAAKPFFGFDARDAYWCDIGTIPEYRRASEDVIEGRFQIGGAELERIAASARIAQSADLSGAVIVRSGAIIEENVVIVGPTTIDQGVRIRAGARVLGSIIWNGATIGERAVVENSIVGADYVVQPGVTITNAVVANEESPALL